MKKLKILIVTQYFWPETFKINDLAKYFANKGHEIIVFHILDPQELKLEYNSRTKFIDMETNKIIETEPWHIQKEYYKMINSHITNLKHACGKNKIDYINICTNQSLDIALAEYLKKRTKIGG